MRRRARVDANHVEVRSALRAAGWTVVDCARIGAGFPDLLIARHGHIRMVEIKDGAKVKSKQQLTEDEVQFHKLMASAGVTVHVVTSVEEALELTRISTAQGDPWVTVDIVDQFTRSSQAPEVQPGALWFPATPETDR